MPKVMTALANNSIMLIKFLKIGGTSVAQHPNDTNRNVLGKIIQ